MATTTDNVIINATINGKKATDELERLQAEAKKLRPAFATHHTKRCFIW